MKREMIRYAKSEAFPLEPRTFYWLKKNAELNPKVLELNVPLEWHLYLVICACPYRPV